MALVVDAGVLYAQADRADPYHGDVSAVLRAERGPLITSQVALAEADYLILTRLGPDVELAFLDDLAEGTYICDCLTQDDLATVRRLAERYRDLKPGLSDLSLVVLAARYRTRRLASLDERAFRVIPPLQGGSFTLLPADM